LRKDCKKGRLMVGAYYLIISERNKKVGKRTSDVKVKIKDNQPYN